MARDFPTRGICVSTNEYKNLVKVILPHPGGRIIITVLRIKVKTGVGREF
jgi:hypothetical protein